MCKVIRCDSPSELPGIHLGTSWTVRIAMQYTKRWKKYREVQIWRIAAAFHAFLTATHVIAN